MVRVFYCHFVEAFEEMRAILYGAIGKQCAPGRNRTCDLPLRRRLLYPTELQAPAGSYGAIVPSKVCDYG